MRNLFLLFSETKTHIGLTDQKKMLPFFNLVNCNKFFLITVAGQIKCIEKERKKEVREREREREGERERERTKKIFSFFIQKRSKSIDNKSCIFSGTNA